ncbi:hypothetical protein C7M47_03106 [Lactiplantibacillus plantarum]|uniref:hypothetical protein n=1 Tax=Lactiplantibacillus plantarum TaxID=1590 RepID=UPI0013673D2F|nr:hypothetical protein [Lactiplantibacillus plantarum]QHM64141.1 hypothetical protein C7M47_03106 [Lactiplantibacillus plantarum]
MKKILSQRDKNQLEEEVLAILVNKKCTLADFEEVTAKVHQIYKDNAVLEMTSSTSGTEMSSLSHHRQQLDTK